ncbi:helix-turn-helix domain-containing protein [Sporosarcina siberiensis]|uniref:Helix-turn-helix domain-containing protein n=1 Tax=Sporosarcina siberiensis TaxID=1365606 RepID=A0ABW4SHC3_9BACL
MSLGSNISSKRKSLKISQEYVAEQLGVSRQAVSKWETNRSEPSTDNLIKLADLFDSDIKELVSPEQYVEEQKEIETRIERNQKNINMQISAVLGRVFTLVGFLGYMGAYSDNASLPDWYPKVWWGVFFSIGLVLSFVGSSDYFKKQFGSKKIIWFDLLFVFTFLFYDMLPFVKDINTLITLLYAIVILSFINIKFFIPVWRTPKLSSK